MKFSVFRCPEASGPAKRSNRRGLLRVLAATLFAAALMTGMFTATAPMTAWADTADYSFDQGNGILTVSTNDGTTAWREDEDIAESEDGRCQAVTSVVIKTGVRTIGEDAFRGCSNLLKLTFEDTTPPDGIGDNAFSGCGGLLYIIIPYGARDAYEDGDIDIIDTITAQEDDADPNMYELPVFTSDSSVTLSKNVGGTFKFEAEHNNGSAILIAYYLIGADIPSGIEFDQETGELTVPEGLAAKNYIFDVQADMSEIASVTQTFKLTIYNPSPSNSSSSNPVPTINPDVVTDLSDMILYGSLDPESPRWVPQRQPGAQVAEGCDVEYFVIVPYGTNLTAMALAYALSAGASCDVPNMALLDYTAKSNEKGGYVDFTVTYQSGSTNRRATHRIYVLEEPRPQIASPDLFAYDPNDQGMTGWTLLGIQNKDGTYWTLISAPLSSDMSARPFPDLVYVDQTGLSGISVAPSTAGDGERRFELRGTASDRAALDGITLNSVSCVWLDEESRMYTQTFEPPVSLANIAATILQEPEELIQYVRSGGGGCDAAAAGAGCLLALTGMAALTRSGRSKKIKK